MQERQAEMKRESIPDEDLVKYFPPGGRLRYFPQWLDAPSADRLLSRLAEELPWAQREILLFGRRVLQPRLVAFQGEPGIAYRYSGTTWYADPWHEEIAGLLLALESLVPGGFNSVLCNAYRDGRDAMGWHADDEPELGENPVIASLSLGAVRRFRLRCRRDHARTWRLEPRHGSLLVMEGDLQHHWQHALARTRVPCGLRINLTFRRIRCRSAGS